MSDDFDSDDQQTHLDAAIAGAVTGTAEIVDSWFIEFFHGLQGLDTNHHNRFLAARDELKKRLAAKE